MGDKRISKASQNNSLLNYNLKTEIWRKHCSFLKTMAAFEKIKRCRKEPPKPIKEEIFPPQQNTYTKNIYTASYSAPVSKLSTKLRKKIINLVTKDRRNIKLTIFMQNYLQDVAKDYNRVLRRQNLICTLHRSGPIYPKRFRFKYFGRTKNYQKYRQNRKKIARNLLNNYPFIRYILSTSILDFPDVLHNFRKYRSDLHIQQDSSFYLGDFANKVTKDLEENSVFIKKTWYPKIVKILRKYYRKNILSKMMWKKAIKCINSLIKRQIGQLKIRTFEHICQIIENHLTIPILKIKIISIDDNIEMSPSFDDIYSVFAQIFDQISQIANNLPVIEHQLDPNFFQTSDDFVRTEIGDVFFKETKDKLHFTLKSTYKPVLDYLQKFRDQYCWMFAKRIPIEIEPSTNIDFKEHMDQIAVYENGIKSLQSCVQIAYFEVAIIDQSEALAELKHLSEKHKNEISDEIVAEHKNRCIKVQMTFNEIERRAMEVPTSTETLLANGEYILKFKTKQMKDIEIEIEETLAICGLILELAMLPSDQKQLQIKLITLYNDLNDIFEQNAAFFEGYKVQFEENLQMVTKKLSTDIDNMIPNIMVINEMSNTDKLREYVGIVTKFIDNLSCFDDYVIWINKEEKLFKFPLSHYPILDEMKNFVVPFAGLLKLCVTWQRYYYVWMDGPFENLNPKLVEQIVEKYHKEFTVLQKTYIGRIKQDLMGNPICKFKGQTEDPDVEKHPVPLKLCSKMISSIDGFRIGVQIVSILCNSSLRPRHWDDMCKVAGFNITPNAGTTLRKFINLKLEDKLETFEIISIGATKELQLKENLTSMINEWSDITFPMIFHRYANIDILDNLDSIQTILDDHTIKTLTMRGSTFVKPFIQDAIVWYEKLYRVDQLFKVIEKVQTNWLYLLPLFSTEEVFKQIAKEGHLFFHVDEIYRKYLTDIKQHSVVIEIAPSAGFLEAIIEAEVMLENVMKGVNNYLEEIRLYFARFFFLSNAEMIEILSETKNPLCVQPYVKKCFEGINSLEFDNDLKIVAMCSSANERISFDMEIDPEEAKGRVEKWLLQVQYRMLESVKREFAHSYLDYAKTDRTKWIVKWAQMICLSISKIFWTSEAHSNLVNGSLEEFFKNLQLNLRNEIDILRTKVLSNCERITVKSLIIEDVFAMEIVEMFIQKNINIDTDFHWLSQLRYYWSDESITATMLDASIPLANEYLGNSARLVITPLTDRCRRSLISTYRLHLNSAVEGSPGTGKTETIKDLAKALAVQCKVFNCSNDLDYRTMEKFFKGLASTGSWACFDQLDRIESEVLSVIAQQMLCISTAHRSKATKCNFQGTEITLNPLCFVCITIDRDYGPDSGLPDNLKLLFRNVAMMSPNSEHIVEVSLCSYGFVDAKILSRKIVTVYCLCFEQLSSQPHYNFGMRAIKSTLSTCEHLKQQFPFENEYSLILKAMLDNSLPKLIENDKLSFHSIISDLFSEHKTITVDHSNIKNEFYTVCIEENLQPEDKLFDKLIQTFETMIYRHGFIMVGDTYSGKSTILKMLRIILARLKITNQHSHYQNFEFEIINPKSVTLSQLFGQMNSISNEWTDGIVSKIFRKFAADTSDVRKMLIFDGPIDIGWIENMNTVLDDNKKLCLNSGEVISMTSEMSIIFEVIDVNQASPSTISRCGMIHTDIEMIGWKAMIASWISKCNKLWTGDWKPFLDGLMSWICPQCLQFVNKHGHQLLRPGAINVVSTTLSIFEILINDAIEEHPEDYSKFMSTWLQAAMIYSTIWGIGGLLDNESREKFDLFFRELWSFNGNCIPPPDNIKAKLDISMPSEGYLIEYLYVFKQKGAWKYWPDMVRRQEPEVCATGIQVPTLDTGRYLYLLELHVKHKKRLLMVGPTGTGKSFYIENALINKFNLEKYVSSFIKFTVLMTAEKLQDLITSKLIKIKRNIYRPPKGKSSLIFIDDISLPNKEFYGAQPPLELLRQYFDHEYIFNLKDMNKLYMEDTLFIAACGLPGGIRQDVYPRFLKHFNCFSINHFSEETMFRIFSNVLLIGLKKNGHASDVVTQVNQIVNASLQVYKQITTNLRPTPNKSHYIFNLRNISKVCLGCSLLRKESVENKKIFPKIWFHEMLREFYDRLVDESDKLWFFNTAAASVSEFFADTMENIFSEFKTENGTIENDDLRTLFFGTYLDLESELAERKYEEVLKLEQFRRAAADALEKFNATCEMKMDIVLFTYALEHLNRICRITSMPASSALLIGVSGSGRQSLTKLASILNSQKLVQLDMSARYGTTEWRQDLKDILKESGGRGKNTIFLLTESHIKYEEFLLDIDSLLHLGEIPNIWAIDEKQEISEMVRDEACGGNKHMDIDAVQLFLYFVKKCKENLHLVMCFSPIGPKLRSRIRLHPTLVDCCTIDWYERWPEEALEMIANGFLKPLNLKSDLSSAIVKAMQHFHATADEYAKRFLDISGRYVFVTPSSYLGFLQSFKFLLTKQQNLINDAKMKYIVGVETINRATETVALMQIDLNELQPKLFVMAENSRKMTLEIQARAIEASVATEQVKRDEAMANTQAAQAEAMEDECSKDLAQAVPVLEEALQALNTLKPNDITLVKSMKNPPIVVKMVMAAVCVMKGIPPDRINDPTTGRKILDYWGPSKKILGDMAFLQSLKEYDKDNIGTDIMNKIRKDFIPHQDFQPHIVAKASSAAEGLCKWIIAMDLYDAVAKVVAPKQARLYAAKELLKETKQFLAQKRLLAGELETKVARLREELANANAVKQKTEDEVRLCQNKLQRATILINSLGGEKERWAEAASNLQALLDNLPVDMLMSSAIISYLSPYTMMYRKSCLDQWIAYCKSISLSISSDFNLMQSLGSEVKAQQWHLFGLPQDSYSTDNAIIMNNSYRYSLFIDPQKQANKWIRSMEKNNRLKIVRFTEDYHKVLETCAEFGIPMLIENIQETIDSTMDAFFDAKNMSTSSEFRLYLTTNLRNPTYPPDVFNKTTVIYFGLTEKGFEEQLLGIVVTKERPDLQELRQKMIVDSAANAEMLEEVEKKILKTLSSSKGDILEDEMAIRILDDSKTLSTNILAKQSVLEKTKIEIEGFRQNYRIIANHATTLYYCIEELSLIDPMYQFSLNWYINLYIFSIENANKSKIFERRLKFLTDELMKNLYTKVCRSLFEKDKIIFSFLLTIKILLLQNQISRTEVDFLLYNNRNPKTDISSEAPAEWITNKQWQDIQNLEELPIFLGFANQFKEDLINWSNYCNSHDLWKTPMPDPWQSTLSSFQRLLIIRIFRPDKLNNVIKNFVLSEIGSAFISPPQISISKSFEESNCLTPLVFILSPDADPMIDLISFSAKMGFDKLLRCTSLGQGQEAIATRMIEDGQKLGAWICLQNCHLAPSWMKNLEAIWENMNMNNTASTFRLWLTSYPTKMFPQEMLQNSVKITNEPADGLQKGLLKLYQSEPLSDDRFYKGCPMNDKAFTRILYGICFFHVLILERKKCGPLGWNVAYGFNQSDFVISVEFLKSILSERKYIQFESIRYMIGDIFYGGRITDKWDAKLMTTILQNFINDRIVNDPTYHLDDDGCFLIPRNTERREIIKFIEENIPIDPEPSVFGLHSNSWITKDIQNSNYIINAMKLTQNYNDASRDLEKGHFTTEFISDVQKILPEPFDISACKSQCPFDYNDSTNTIIIHEMERYNQLLVIIRKTCSDLEYMLDGKIVLTPDMEDISTSIQFHKIPNTWLNVSYPSLKPIASYIRNLECRLTWLRNWYETRILATFWLSGLYFPQSLLTGILQNYARKTTVSIEILTFDFDVEDVEFKDNTADCGAYINGLFMDGGRWNWQDKCIVEQCPRKLYEKMPAIHFKPIISNELQEGNRYQCPVYKTTERNGILSDTGHSTNYILPIFLHAQKDRKHWTKRSVALICETNE